MWDLIVSVPDHCLSFYLVIRRLISLCEYYVFDIIFEITIVCRNAIPYYT